VNRRRRKKALSKWIAEASGDQHARITLQEREYIERLWSDDFPQEISIACGLTGRALEDMAKAAEIAVFQLLRHKDSLVARQDRATLQTRMEDAR